MSLKKHFLRILFILFIVPLFILQGCDKNPINDLAEDIADQIEETEELDNGPEVKEEQEQDQQEEDDDDDDDDNDEETQSTGSMTAIANGEEFSTSGYFEQAAFNFASITKSDDLYILYIVGFDLDLGLEKDKTIFLWAVGEDFSELKAGKSWDTPLVDFLHDGVIANYDESEVTDDEEGDDGDDDSSLEKIESISLEITAIDFEKQLISGEFSFSGSTEDGTTITVTEGKFVDYTFDYSE